MASSKSMYLLLYRLSSAWSMVCMPYCDPVCITLHIWGVFASRMRFFTASLAIMISTAATRPVPSRRGIRVW